MLDGNNTIGRRGYLKGVGATGSIAIAGLSGCLTGGSDNGTEGESDDDSDGGSNGTTNGGSDDTESSEPITIGALEPQSGPFAPWASTHLSGLQMAVAEINDDGGVLGRDLELATSDTQADPGEADSIFRRLAEQQDVVATTGAVSSDVGIRVSQTAEDLEIPHFLHMAGSNEVITEDTQNVFRVGLLPAQRYVQAQTAIAQEQGYTNIAAIIGDYAWGRSTEQSIEENFSGDVNIMAAPVGASDFSSYIRQISDDVEMVIASGHPPGSPTIANQLFELGYSPEVITGAGIPPQVLASALNEDPLNAFVHPTNSDPYGQPFQDVGSRFAESNDTQFNTHTAYGYVTGKLLAHAIEEGGEASPSAISQATKNVEFDTLFANPITYTEHGELDNTTLVFNRVLQGAPDYDPDGSLRFEEVARSEPIPALPAGE
jgi:branched-chain amino acid transport system substrate-binding protein